MPILVDCASTSPTLLLRGVRCVDATIQFQEHSGFSAHPLSDTDVALSDRAFAKAVRLRGREESTSSVGGELNRSMRWGDTEGCFGVGLRVECSGVNVCSQHN